MFICCWLMGASAVSSLLFAAGPVRLGEMKLRGTNGKPVMLPPARWTVVCFLGTECPLAKLYGPRLQSLADEFSEHEIAFVAVNSNIQDSPREIDAYAAKHDIDFPMIKDADQSIADAFGAERTPQIFVINTSGLVLYQGRIDDQYEPGITRAKPTKHDLRDALEALIDGREVPNAATQAVGCRITRFNQRQAMANGGSTVTFSRDVAPILVEHCVECHRAGEIGPMALIQYDEVIGWAEMILEVVDQKRMPPWHADPSVGHFVGQRVFPQQARDTIATWIDQGMPEGNPAELPEIPRRERSWAFSTPPNAEFAMRNRPFVVPASGVVEYQYYVVDPGWTRDHWISAAQVIPGQRSVVHHVIVFVRPPDGTGFKGIGCLGAYVPGQRPIRLPPGHARRVPAGSKLVFQMHYTPNGRVTEDLSRIGIWETPADQVTHEVVTQLAIDHKFEIPPGEHDFAVEMTAGPFSKDSRMLGITPHMHLRGRSFRLRSRRANGPIEDLLHVPAYDFNWQHWYQFSEPIELGEIEQLEMTVMFDNSAANPFNPDPEQYVDWGEQTWEEMAVAFFDIAVPRGKSIYPKPVAVELTVQQLAARENRIAQQVKRFMDQTDANGDGIIERDETAVTFRHFGFHRFDRNGDRKITADEVRAQVAERM